jgi:CMP/dCMP kinase
VSTAAAHAEVRAALHAAQRAFLEEGDAVAEGRDVGGAVWPEAELKIWLDADPRERIRRRSAERGGDEVEQALIERDQADAPNMLRAPDAVIVDTTRLSADEAIEVIVELARERGA